MTALRAESIERQGTEAGTRTGLAALGQTKGP
jgi:hypothetical protein